VGGTNATGFISPDLVPRFFCKRSALFKCLAALHSFQRRIGRTHVAHCCQSCKYDCESKSQYQCSKDESRAHLPGSLQNIHPGAFYISALFTQPPSLVRAVPRKLELAFEARHGIVPFDGNRACSFIFHNKAPREHFPQGSSGRIESKQTSWPTV